MHPGAQTKIRPQQPAFVMAAGGDTVTYAGLELRSNQLAHFLRASGLRRLDHYAIFGPQIKRLTDFGYHRIKIKIGGRNRSFADSPLEGDGFELPVPREIGSVSALGRPRRAVPSIKPQQGRSGAGSLGSDVATSMTAETAVQLGT